MSQRNYNQSTIDVISDIQLGICVERAAAATAGALTPMFNIIGGPVLMTAFYGKVTVEAVGATTIVIAATPTVGATVPVSASLDVDPAVVGSYLTITGLASDAMKYNATAGGLGMFLYKGIIIPVGTLDYTGGAASGSIAWTMFYVPLTTGAYVTAT
jgi:hypothetical protein